MRNYISASRRFAVLSCILIMLLLSQGCATLKNSRRDEKIRRREKLSKALEKASDDYKGERTVSRPKRVSRDDDDDDGDDFWHRPPPEEEKEKKPESIPTHTKRPRRKKESSSPEMAPLVGLMGGIGSISGDDFERMGNVNALFGLSNEIGNIELFGGYEWAPFRKESEHYASIDDRMKILKFGAQAKFCISPPHTALSPYIQLGASYNWMRWNYRNALTDGDADISSDSLDGIELYTGVGAMLRQEKTYQLSAAILPGVTFWGSRTGEGFENDEFERFWTLKFRVTASFFP